MVLVDVSTSLADFNTIRDALATVTLMILLVFGFATWFCFEAVESKFDAVHSRLAVVLFSTGSENVLTFESGEGKSSAELANEIRSLSYGDGGSTWTAQALVDAKTSFWTPTLDEEQRQRLTVIVSDGKAMTTQEPCEMIQDYVTNGIDVVTYTIGGSTQCTEVTGKLFVLSVVESVFCVFCFELQWNMLAATGIKFVIVRCLT